MPRVPPLVAHEEWLYRTLDLLGFWRYQGSKCVDELRLMDVHKSFGNLEVLKGVSLSANSGEVLSIIGARGSGKSTLLRCINLLEVPEKGRMFLGGDEIDFGLCATGRFSETRRSHLRTQVGMVFQSFNLWPHMTVLENVIEAPIHILGMARKDAVDEAMSLLAKVGLTESRMPGHRHFREGNSNAWQLHVHLP